MKKISTIKLFFAIIFLFTINISAQDFKESTWHLNKRADTSQNVSGDVSGVWDVDSVYVDGDITIPENSTLTIMPGTIVYFTNQYKFDIKGQLLANGTETDSILFSSKTMESPGNWYGMSFLSTKVNRQPASSIEYCRIENGGISSWMGGTPSMNIKKSDPKISNITIANSMSLGLSVYSSNINFDNLTLNLTYGLGISHSDVTLNNLKIYNKGGLSIWDSSKVLLKNSIIDGYNTGTGVFGKDSEIEIKDSEIINNKLGLQIEKCPKIELDRVKISNNKYDGNSYGESGGMFVIASNPVLKNVEIINNSNFIRGGGFVLTYDGNGTPSTNYKATLQNCLIVKNEAISSNSESGVGGGFYFWKNCDAEIINCTIADNIAKSNGAIKNFGDASDVQVKNSIIYNNGNDLEFQAGWANYSYSIVQGGYPGQDTSTTNLQDVDPLFRDVTNDNYHLKSSDCGNSATSPGIDSGAPIISDYVLDCASGGLGTKRSDMGAYGGEGNRWDRSILPDCHFAGEVSGTWECERIYIDGDVTIPFGDTLKITDAVDKVLITGPFQIKVEGVLIAKGPEDARVGLNGEQLLFQGSTWKGILFNNLNDSNPGTSIIENCRFDYANKMDMTYQGGGAIALYNSDNVIVRGSVFYANQAKLGGALYIENSDAYIEYCHFDLNGKGREQYGKASATAGGAMFVRNSNPYLHKLYFINNHSISGGGAIVLDNSSPTMTNIMMVRNFTEGLGGAIHLVNGASPKIVNMTTSENVAERGGAFYLNPNSSPTIINSIMYNDTKPEIYYGGERTMPIVTYSIIDGASSEVYFGEGCLDISPNLVAGVEYRLANNSCNYSGGSDVISPAIDAGHPDSLDVKLDCKEGLGTSRADMGYYGGRYTNTQILGIDDGIDNSSSKYILDQNHPNPFSLTTSISFTLPKSGLVSLKVYNILGEEISTLINKEMDKGVNSIVFDASSLSSGIYFYQISVD
ncbi:MAG: T9SS type A sorting domain-containing protein, partial [Sulfurovaceae bacterium]|nr:T9SS type A sorting domain-containing protein [Sulfurovaceae bacterium]